LIKASELENKGEKMEIDITNIQAVGVKGDDIVVLAPKQIMSKQEALVHAAWLVCLADEENAGDLFEEILTKVTTS
jgi:hypothetical protein